MHLFWFVVACCSCTVLESNELSQRWFISYKRKKNAFTKTSKHRLFLSTVCKMCLSNQTCLLMDLQGWSQQPQGNWTGNNRQSTSWRYREKKITLLQIIWEGLMLYYLSGCATSRPLNAETACGWALAATQGAITSDEWSWVFGSRFWFFQNVMIHHGLSSALRQQEEGGRRSCSAWRLISPTPGVARAPWLPSPTAFLHADEADNLLPFLTLETRTDCCAAPSLLPYDLLNLLE